jgi:hypothetical protein
LLSDGVKGIEIVYKEGEKICILPTRTAKAEQKSLVLAWQEQQTNKGGPLSFVLFESPFASVSTVSRDHLSSLSGHPYMIPVASYCSSKRKHFLQDIDTNVKVRERTFLNYLYVAMRVHQRTG